MTRNLVIVGSGPSAWTAAIYAARAQLNPTVFTGFQMGGVRGGQLMLTTDVENYPGFPIGLGGPELVTLMEEQARKFGIQVIEEDVLGIEQIDREIMVQGAKTEIKTHALVIATGAYAKRLAVKGDEEFWGKGISACAVCDGAIPVFRDQDLAVIGGGDTACEEALFLTKYGKKVYLVMRREEFRASKIMTQRVRESPKIEVLGGYGVEEIYGEKVVHGLKLKNVKSSELRDLPVKGAFYGIGHQPNTTFLHGKVKLDDNGYLITKAGTTETSVPGLFGAGDVSDHRYRQAVTAAGMGCMAALDAERYLTENGIQLEVELSEKGS